MRRIPAPARERGSPRPDRPVFVADRGFRQALTQATIVLGAALLAGWLIALIVGALGWGRLPGVPYVGGANGNPSTPLSPGSEPTRGSVTTQAPFDSAIHPAPISSSGDPRSFPGDPLSSGALRSLSRSHSTLPHRARSPFAFSTPPSNPISSTVAPRQGSGSRQGAGSQSHTGIPSSPGASTTTSPPHGTGSANGQSSDRRSTNRGSSSTTLSRESGQPAETPNGNLPAQNALPGNPSALARGKGGNPAH
jgi:hypothetical protein